MMGLNILDLILIAIGGLVFILWLIIYIQGLKYNELFEPLEESDFLFKEIYGMGYYVLEKFKYEYKSKSDRTLRQQLYILYGEKYTEYYLRAIHSQQITLSLTFLVIAFALYGLADDVLAFVVGVILSVLAYFYFGTLTSKKILARSEELLHDFSEVVSKLALLTNAGMILKEAWEEVAYNGAGIFYEEMQNAVVEMRNGISEIDAIYNFGTRCILPEIKKFSSTVVQGLTKGSGDLTIMLQEQSKEVWQLKKQLVRRAGEKANSKLLIPICIMFIGILIMIIVPIFTNLGV